MTEPDSEYAYDGLPEGWVECLMGDIADVIGGGTPKSTDRANFADDGHPWITPADLSDFKGVYISRGRRGLSDAGLAGCSARLVPQGTVLMSSRAPIGYVAIAANDVCTNQGFKSFVCHPELLPEFVFHWLRFIRPTIEEMGSGSTFTEVSGSRCREIPCRFPPVAEQRRIVAKVEELLARVNAARERLAKVPAILKRFRQSILAAACSGQLTTDWRESDEQAETASAFIEQVARDHRVDPLFIESEEPLPEGWARTTFGFLADPSLRGKAFVTSGSRGWASYVSDHGPYFIRSENINTECLRLADAIRVRPPAGPETDRSRVHANDLLLTITGNNVGRTAVVPSPCPAAHVSQHVAIIRFNKQCFTHYCWLWLRSKEHGQKQLVDSFYGETKPGLNLDQIKAVTIDLPPIGEQREIIRRVEALFALADKIEARVQAATARMEKTTQAILAKAFRGELVPTEAELARRESRPYEPASALLERVSAERAVPVESNGKPRRSGHSKAGRIQQRGAASEASSAKSRRRRKKTASRPRRKH